MNAIYRLAAAPEIVPKKSKTTAQSHDIRDLRFRPDDRLFRLRPADFRGFGFREPPERELFALALRDLEGFAPRLVDDEAGLLRFSPSLPADFLRFFELDLPFADEGLCFFPAMAHLINRNTQT